MSKNYTEKLWLSRRNHILTFGHSLKLWYVILHCSYCEYHSFVRAIKIVKLPEIFFELSHETFTHFNTPYSCLVK